MKKIFTIILFFILIYFGFFTFSASAKMVMSLSSSTPKNGDTFPSNSSVTIGANSYLDDDYDFVNDWNNTLVGWWKFNSDGDLKDYSSYDHALDNHGTEWTSSGKFGGAYNFDGSGYMSVPEADEFDGSDFTFSTWVKNTASEFIWNRIVSKKSDYLSTSGWEITLDMSDSGSRDVFVSGSSGNFAVFDCADFTDYKWHHIVAVYSGSNVTLYCDGANKGTQGIDRVVPNDNPILIGRTADEDGSLWRGAIDEVQIYNRALSTDEVDALYDHNYNHTFPNLSPGAYTYQIFMQDTTGNLWYSMNTHFTVEPATPSENDSQSAQKPKISSWSAFKYQDNYYCAQRLQLTINGHRFDKDASAFIGEKEASSISRKSSQKIIAKFCLTKLLDNATDHKRVISVKNPNTDEVEASKQIDLANVSDENGSTANTTNVDYFTMQTNEGVKHIQEVLNKLGYLDVENITGVYGPITTATVQKFQQDNGIDPATGFVGYLTKAKLQEKMQ